MKIVFHQNTFYAHYCHIHILFGQIQIQGLCQFQDNPQIEYMMFVLYLQLFEMKTMHNHRWIYIETNKIFCHQQCQSTRFDPRMNKNKAGLNQIFT